MAFRVGGSAYFVFNQLNLTNSLATEVRDAMTGDAIDVSTIGNNFKAYLQGQSGVQLTVSGVWDNGTAVTNLDAVLFNNLNGGGTKLWEYMPGGSASGVPLYKGNGIVTSYEISSPLGDKVGFSCTIMGSDAPVRSIAA